MRNSHKLYQYEVSPRLQITGRDSAEWLFFGCSRSVRKSRSD